MIEARASACFPMVFLDIFLHWGIWETHKKQQNKYLQSCADQSEQSSISGQTKLFIANLGHPWIPKQTKVQFELAIQDSCVGDQGDLVPTSVPPDWIGSPLGVIYTYLHLSTENGG